MRASPGKRAALHSEVRHSPLVVRGCEVLSRIGVPVSGRGGSVGRSFRPQKIAPRGARQVDRSGSKSLENVRKRLKRLKTSSRQTPWGQKTVGRIGRGGSDPKKPIFPPPRFARRVGRSGQTESETQKSQEGVGRSGTPILVLKPRTPFGRVCVSRMVADGYSQYS